MASKEIKYPGSIFGVFCYHKKNNKAIAHRYDNLGDSKWLATVVELYSEKIISDEDIESFSLEVKKVFEHY